MIKLKKIRNWRLNEEKSPDGKFDIKKINSMIESFILSLELFSYINNFLLNLIFPLIPYTYGLTAHVLILLIYHVISVVLCEGDARVQARLSCNGFV